VSSLASSSLNLLTLRQFIRTEYLCHRIHSLPTRHRSPSFSAQSPYYSSDTRVYHFDSMVFSSRCQHLGWIRSCKKSGRHCCLSTIRILFGPGLFMLYQLSELLGDGKESAKFQWQGVLLSQALAQSRYH